MTWNTLLYHPSRTIQKFTGNPLPQSDFGTMPVTFEPA